MQGVNGFVTIALAARISRAPAGSMQSRAIVQIAAAGRTVASSKHAFATVVVA